MSKIKKESDRIYKELKKKYTDEEIAKSYIFPSDPPTDEELEALSKMMYSKVDEKIYKKFNILIKNKKKNR